MGSGVASAGGNTQKADQRTGMRAGVNVSKANRPRRRSRLRAWLPQYHGGWAMVIVPPALGLTAGRIAPQLLLVCTWLVGYFLYYATTVWLRSRMKRRYLPQVLVYGAATCALGITTLASAPGLMAWIPVYAPILGFAAIQAWRRAERSLASGMVTIAAACLLLPVMYDAAHGTSFGCPAAVWVRAILLFGYFAGTVLYVKTNIRERGNMAYLRGSLAWHLVWFAIATALAARGYASWWHVATWAIVAARAAAVPGFGRVTGRRVSVTWIGFGEIPLCLAVALTLFW